MQKKLRIHDPGGLGAMDNALPASCSGRLWFSLAALALAPSS